MVSTCSIFPANTVNGTWRQLVGGEVGRLHRVQLVDRVAGAGGWSASGAGRWLATGGGCYEERTELGLLDCGVVRGRGGRVVRLLVIARHQLVQCVYAAFCLHLPALC